MLNWFMNWMKVSAIVLVLLTIWIMRPGTQSVDDRVAEKAVKEVSSITNLTEATNSDGSRRLSGTSELRDDGIHYTFSATDATKNGKIQIFETTVPKGSSLTIPFNSWASDNKYVFLTANFPDGKTYYVFDAEGANFKDGLKYLDVAEYWESSKMEKKLDHVSGWAGPGLLVVYATNQDGSDSFAYWFVVSTRKFMNVREL